MPANWAVITTMLCDVKVSFSKQHVAAKIANPDALVYAKPFGYFTMIARARGPRIAHRQETGSGVIIHGVGTVPGQDLLKANDARSRGRHISQEKSSKIAVGRMLKHCSMLTVQLLYLHSDS
jgi:hypothetical protein